MGTELNETDQVLIFLFIILGKKFIEKLLSEQTGDLIMKIETKFLNTLK